MIRDCIEKIVKYINVIGIEILRLDVRADTKIERFWKMMGFEPFGKMKDFMHKLMDIVIQEHLCGNM